MTDMTGFYSPITSRPLVEGTFLTRPNRFCVHCMIDGRETNVFMPNPGRMKELLLPGVKLILADHGRLDYRNTRYTVMAVKYQDHIVFLHTHLNNVASQRLIDARAIPGLRDFSVERTEVTVGDHRFDMLLRDGEGDLYLEVKSCTLSANGIAMFPDAVTERGRRHLLSLARMNREGQRSALLFLIHHGNANRFLPDYHTDLAFSSAFCDVEDRLPVIAVALEWTPDLRYRVLNPRVTIPWDVIRRECVDRGHLVQVERDGTGYRVSLTRYLIELSKKTRKRSGEVFPIRSSIDESESMAGVLSGLYEKPVENSDGWAFRIEGDPVPTPGFQQALLDFRMPRRLQAGIL